MYLSSKIINSLKHWKNKFMNNTYSGHTLELTMQTAENKKYKPIAFRYAGQNLECDIAIADYRTYDKDFWDKMN